MSEQKEHDSYHAQMQKAEYENNMEKSAFAQYVTAGASMHTNESKRIMDIKEFRRTYYENGYQKKIFVIAVIAYIIIAFHVITSVLYSITGLADCAIFATLVIGIHKKKSKGCAIGLLAYSILNWLVVFLATSNLFSGWVWIAISAGSLYMIQKADKAYAQMYR